VFNRTKNMKKVFILGIIAICLTFNVSAQESIFNNTRYLSIEFDAVNNPSFKNLTFITDFDFNSKKVSVMSKYDSEGNLSFVGTDNNDIGKASDPNKQCGRACMGCQSDYGCWICYIGCVLFKMDPAGSVVDHNAYANIKIGETVALDGLKYTKFYSNDGISANNSSKMSVYNGEKLMSAVNFNFDDNYSIANMFVFFEDPQLANTPFGKCLMDCGINAKTNWGAVLCAWDCLAKMPQTSNVLAN
jgi:hypothetical protein